MFSVIEFITKMYALSWRKTLMYIDMSGFITSKTTFQFDDFRAGTSLGLWAQGMMVRLRCDLIYTFFIIEHFVFGWLRGHSPGI